MSDESLWIFGYGSLVWRPAFPHRRRVPASIDGFVRRFWQGSIDHRGVPGRPGRVVTLLPADHATLAAERVATGAGERCWGMAYEVGPGAREVVLAGLDHRERGGYERHRIELRLRPETAPSDGPRTPPETAVAGLVYVAGPDNEGFLGPAPIEAIARQIAGAHGPSGANPEYVFRLGQSLRAMGAEDAHVFAIETALGRLLGGGPGDGDAGGPGEGEGQGEGEGTPR